MLTTTEQSRTGKSVAAPAITLASARGHRSFHQVRRSEYLRVVIRAVSRSGSRADSAGRSRSGLAVTLR